MLCVAPFFRFPGSRSAFVLRFFTVIAVLWAVEHALLLVGKGVTKPAALCGICARRRQVHVERLRFCDMERRWQPDKMACLPMHFGALYRTFFPFSGVAFCTVLRFFTVIAVFMGGRTCPLVVGEGVSRPQRFVASVRAADTWRDYEFARWNARGNPGQVRRIFCQVGFFAHAWCSMPFPCANIP